VELHFAETPEEAVEQAFELATDSTRTYRIEEAETFLS